MKPKANLVLVLSIVALVFPARGQVANNPPVPSVPRADGSGPSVPSMSPAIGDIPTPPPSTSKPAARSAAPATTAAELEASARAAERSTPTAAANGAATASTPASAGKTGPTMPANKAWALEGSPTVSSTGPASPASEVLDTTTLTQQIRGLPLASRPDFLNSLEKRVEGTDRDLNEMRQTSRQLQGDSRATYLKADEDMKAKHKALKRSLKEARSATPENWVKARDTLASDYEAYSVALVRVEASSVVGR